MDVAVLEGGVTSKLGARSANVLTVNLNATHLSHELLLEDEGTLRALLEDGELAHIERRVRTFLLISTGSTGGRQDCRRHVYDRRQAAGSCTYHGERVHLCIVSIVVATCYRRRDHVAR